MVVTAYGCTSLTTFASLLTAHAVSSKQHLLEHISNLKYILQTKPIFYETVLIHA
jgi:hypothetical protein